MSRNEKLSKLARAVREWRGLSNPRTGKWIKTPNAAAVPRVGRWLAELGLDTVETFELLSGFKALSEFDAWLRKQ